MKYDYPHELLGLVNRALEESHEVLYSTRPNENAVLSAILGTVYHASFLFEEGRPLLIHVAYANPQFFIDTKNAVDTRAIVSRFERPLSFTIAELMRVAPAVDPWNTAVLVCESDSVGLNQNGIAIWGLLILRSDQEKRLAGERAHPYVPPHVLTITSSNPGHVAVGVAGRAVALLAKGEARIVAGEIVRLFDIAWLFRSTLRDLDNAVASTFGCERLPSIELQEFWSEWPYVTVLRRLLHLVVRRAHGGCFLFLPPSHFPQLDSDEKLHVKYPIVMPLLWNALVYKCANILAREAASHRGELSSLFGKSPKFDLQVLEDPLVTRAMCGEDVDPILEDVTATIAALTQVNGAVVLSDKLLCLGFGCEIRIPPSIELPVVRAKNPQATSTIKIQSESFGTRHRSAFRFCAAYPGAVALVVSQDGEAKICTQRDGMVVFWPITPLGVFLE